MLVESCIGKIGMQHFTGSCYKAIGAMALDNLKRQPKHA